MKKERIPIVTNNRPERKSMINLRGGFSESMGIKSFDYALQMDEFSNRTRTMICNALFDLLVDAFEGNSKTEPYELIRDNNKGHEFSKMILSEVFEEETILGQYKMFDWRAVFNELREVIRKAPYNEVLDLLECIYKWLDSNFYTIDGTYVSNIYVELNDLFEKECVGYRFIDGIIAPISDEIEVETLVTTFMTGYQGVKTHFRKAIGFLSNRDNPDYKNSIKESISAVESICKIITNSPSATLGDALKRLKDNGCPIHSAMEGGFAKLYGYTSDQGGIRHAEGMFESNVTFDEAKYMLISCSAFVNYLISAYSSVK